MDKKNIDFDILLTYLCKNGKSRIDVIDCIDDVKERCLELESLGFVYIDEVVPSLISWVYPTEKGKECFRNGGIIKEINTRRKNNIIKNWTFIGVWISICISIYK